MKKYLDTNVMLGFAVMAIVAMLIIPLPTILLDFLMGISIMIGLIALLQTMMNQKSSDLSVFPTLLLVTTVFRLALNVSSTRLILLDGPAFDGKLVKAFGDFVVGGNYIIGFVIFLILIFVQMMVITKGATRISEVSARFTLDALPGKQMSIDNDLSSGLITEEEARFKRDELRKEVNFFGQMDGAAKFVQGDVKVGLIITAINLIGGIIIGVISRGETVGEAAKVYSLLTIGDGLVAQIPSLLITTATGMVVTRAGSEKDLGKEFSSQLFSNVKILWMVSAALFLISLIPAFPKVPLWLTSGFLGFIAYKTSKSAETVHKQEEKQEREEQSSVSKTDRFLDEIKVDPLALEVGYQLIPIVDPRQGGALLERITRLRQKFAKEMGMIIPPVGISDNMHLNEFEYSILVGGISIAKAKIYPDKLVALDFGKVTEPIEGEAYIEPTKGVQGILIPIDQRREAEQHEYKVMDANSIIINHLGAIFREYSAQIMGREEVKLLMDKIKERAPSLVEEVLDVTKMSVIHQILINLLKESVSIKNMILILESIADNVVKSENPDPDYLTELVRQKLGRQIVSQYIQEGVLQVIRIDPIIENEMNASLTFDEIEGSIFTLDPDLRQQILNSLLEAFNYAQENKILPIFITNQRIRLGIHSLLEREINLQSFVVIAIEEIPQNINVQIIREALITQENQEEAIRGI